MSLPWIIVGNPENRRVTMFQEALVGCGQRSARVLSWLDVARDVDGWQRVLDAPAIVRIDSFGESFDVDRELYKLGYDAAVAAGVSVVTPDAVATLPYDRGLVLAPRQHHLGFERALGRLAHALAARPHLRVLNVPESLARMFDKRRCAADFAAAGIPAPTALPGITSIEGLHAAMDGQERRVFVKLSCGSSASCLGLYERSGDGGAFFTSMEIDGDRIYNSLRPRRYTDPRSIDRLLAFLLREGSHVEAAVPKATSGGHFFDTRMLVVGGEVAFTVMRKSRHPITNLHLGGSRGTLEELAAAVPAAALRAAEASCERLFRLYDTLHVGVDVMFTPRGQDHRVLEVNAFGDLFPNLTRDGKGVYAWEIERALA